MFESALDRCNDQRHGEVIQAGVRFKETLARIVPGWKLTPKEGRGLKETSIELATKRVNAILEGGDSGAYNRAATLAVGAAEILMSHESMAAANQWLDGFVTRNKRKRSFSAELKRCREQMRVTGDG